MRAAFVLAMACTTTTTITITQVLGLVVPTPSSFHRLSYQTTMRRRRVVHHHPIQQQQLQQQRQRHILLASSNDQDEDDDDEDDDYEEEMDWREMRARLIARDKAEKSSTSPTTTNAPTTTEQSPPPSSSYVYETPLIEQGTILLGGTKMEFGFALRQQFFHKSVMLLLQHDETFTKGIILNRPSALEVGGEDGWRAWCGHGQVAEGGLFVGAERKMGELEINALHSLTSTEANNVSTRVIKGVSYTSLENAKALVKAGVATKNDFWVCVGYSGWAPGQLQNEVEARDSWYLASADSGTLLTELLREAKELPPLTPGGDDGDGEGGSMVMDSGIGTWSNLMKGIGRGDDVIRSMDTLEDRMLEQWVRIHLVPKPKSPTPSTPPSEIKVGTVLGTMASPQTSFPADRILIHDQYLHKSLLLILDASAPSGKVSAVILNRPTSQSFKFTLPGSPKRRVPFTGNIPVGADLWLHYRPELSGIPLGESGVWIQPTEGVSDLIEKGMAQPNDFLLIKGVVQFGKPEIAGMLAAGEMRCIPPGKQLSKLWPRVWSLTDDADDGNSSSRSSSSSSVSDGTELWWLASQCGGDESSGEEPTQQPVASVPSDLADEALAEWLKFFAGVVRS